MPDLVILVILFSVGALALVAEIFIPSHGILTVMGLGFLVAGVVMTFQSAGRDAGIVAVVACGVAIPTFGYLAVKYWPQTTIGKLIAPPNPVITPADTSVPVEEINDLIGTTGRAVSVLRPVGICEFNGRRISCVARFGMIEAGAEVEGVGMTGTNLAVIEKKA
ncbi:MAG: hypothetical protein ACE5E5_13845 [Phycisphaerae bacterium]